MGKPIVSIARYEKPSLSVIKAVDLCGGLDHLPSKAKVLIKPNLVLWTRYAVFPKWGTLTTSRVVEDIVILLKERGIDDITIAEGMVLSHPEDTITPKHAFEALGYNVLKQRYGVESINVHTRPFEEVDLGSSVLLNFNIDYLQSDFVVNIPVLKTHHQSVVSLGIKNLMGVVDIESRKIIHNRDPGKDLDYMIAKLANKLRPSFTLLDGIYTNERGPSINGKIRRSNVLVGSTDTLAADMVGAKLLGYEPSAVPHILNVARENKRPSDLSGVEVVGETIENTASFHEYDFPFDEDKKLPMFMVRSSVEGLRFRKYDLTVCTYCADLYPVFLAAAARAWQGVPWEDVEVLTGKVMEPSPGMKKTLLIGKCIYEAHKDNPNIHEMIAVKGCPPDLTSVVEAFYKAGIETDPSIIENWEANLGQLMKKYEGRPEFNESFFHIR
jgi:uncharacterized protein (DUF362 family)